MDSHFGSHCPLKITKSKNHKINKKIILRQIKIKPVLYVKHNCSTRMFTKFQVKRTPKKKVMAITQRLKK